LFIIQYKLFGFIPACQGPDNAVEQTDMSKSSVSPSQQLNESRPMKHIFISSPIREYSFQENAWFGDADQELCHVQELPAVPPSESFVSDRGDGADLVISSPAVPFAEAKYTN
jgi:hypothetical protein